MKQSERCPVNGKRRYRDHEEALEALRRIQARNRREKTPVRAYEHPACGGYHITAQKEWDTDAKKPRR